MGKWAEPELTFGFLAACLPVLPAFVKHILRTSIGLKVRSLWTSSPLTDGTSKKGPYCGSSGRQVRTIGSYGKNAKEKGAKITKVVEMDIEFEELTKESRDQSGPVAGRSRASSHKGDEEWAMGARALQQKASTGPLRQ